MSEDDTAPASTVRPYMLTGGRTRSAGKELALEAVVRSCSIQQPGGSAERLKIVGAVRERVLSVAEISAHLGLPFGVVRVLVGDLVDEGLLTAGVTVGATAGGAADDGTSPDHVDLLESVLDALKSL